MRTSKYIMLLLLSGCAGQASPQTLKEKLAAVEPQERTRTIRNICLTEAEWRKEQLVSYQGRHYGGKNAYVSIPLMPDVERLKDICWEMTKLYPPKKG
jgi:hypothetical protein